jgi:hypothetical protein
MANIQWRVDQLKEDLASLKPPAPPASLSKYANDPCGYTADVLKIQLTEQQKAIANAILEPPRKVKVPSGHNVGKSFIAAVLVNWWFDSFDPGIVITTAPSEKALIDTLWSEIRMQRQKAGLSMPFIGPRAPEMRTSESHWAKGYVAAKSESFQGKHRGRQLIVFDEDEGCDPAYWTAAKSMFKPELGHAWLCIGNPTTNDSQSALEELAIDAAGNPAWRIIRLSALDHPNIHAQLHGQPPAVPNAVTLDQARQWISDWCEPIGASDKADGDFEFPVGSNLWYRPGPIGEARILGRRPTQGTYGVWSPALFDRAISTPLEVPKDELPQIGADVARFGDDYTCLHVRCGPVSLAHLSANGLSITETAGRIKLLASQFYGHARQVPIYVDDDGVGGGVVDILRDGGFNVVPVSAGSKARKPDDYPNRRSELWFRVADRARTGQLDLTRLSRDTIYRLRQQSLAPVWKLDAQCRRVVEPKADTKKKIGRSPDDMDAVNLAYCQEGKCEPPVPVSPVIERRRSPHGDLPGGRESKLYGAFNMSRCDSAAQRRGLFGHSRGSMIADGAENV